MQSCTGGLSCVEIADQANQLAVALIASRGIPCHCASNAASPALPDTAASVDQEVVGNVVPTLLRAGVKVIKATQDPRCICGPVPIPRRRVMHQEKLDFFG